jgi:hypothetical protein
LRIEVRLRRIPNAPGSSKRKHFELANEKKTRRDFTWSPNQPDRGERRQQDRPGVEPPRPQGWKPLILTAQAIRIQQDAWERGNDCLKVCLREYHGFLRQVCDLVQKCRQEPEEERKTSGRERERDPTMIG